MDLGWLAPVTNALGLTKKTNPTPVSDPFSGGKMITQQQYGGYAPNTPAPTTNYGDLNSQLKSYADQLKALQYQIAQQPKIYSYDVAGGAAKARAAAEGAVNPFYTKKLNDFLAQEETKKQRSQQDYTTQNQQIEQALQDAIDTSNISRNRTTEDTGTKLADIGNQENYFQNTEGTQFDRARQALLSQGAQSGMLGSGLGNQQDVNAISDRNATSAQQVQDFNNQKAATELFKTRTFEDLSRTDALNTRGAGQKKESNQINLDRALQDIGTETEGFKFQNEADRLGAVLGEQQRQQQLDYGSFIQGLIGSGARNQDVAATSQAYSGLF